jgi:hypothetical protein
MKKCKCGKDLASDARSCPVCGKLKLLLAFLFLVPLVAVIATAVGKGGRDNSVATEVESKAAYRYEQLSERAGVGAASLYAAARNPDTLKFESVLGMDDGTICYEYRAQNGFGGMNRERAVLLPNAKSLTTSSVAWNKRCANKSGDDVTLNAENLMRLFNKR